MRIALYTLLLLVGLNSMAQPTPHVDFLTGKVAISIDPLKKEISGKVSYTCKVIQAVDTIAIDARTMRDVSVTVAGAPANFRYENDKVKIIQPFNTGQEYEITIGYTVTPKQAVYFVKDYEGKEQIWTQGQGKYTSNWLPSFDDVNEKVVYDLTIDYHKDYEVIANGKLLKKEMIDTTTQRWHYDMQRPMSSYLLAFVIGQYKKITKTAKKGTPLLLYYYPNQTDKVDATYAHTQRIFDFLEDEIGYAYPWQNYKQVPVKDFLYAGMENTGTTIFSDAFVVDEIAYTDRNYINVNAHELAHQWFGNLVTATASTHHWLQEGFATYYALLAEKEIFGEDYFLYKLYESAEQLTAQSKKETATSLLDSKASSLTFYQRGAWALHALKHQIGATDFKIAVHNYLQKHQFQSVTTTDFIRIAEEVSGIDLTKYRQTWLENTAFPSQKALDMLAKSSFMQSYLSLAQQRTQPLAGKWKELAKALQFPVNTYIGQEAVYQLLAETAPETEALVDQAFETNDVYVRQAIAMSSTRIPSGLQKQFESLLSDQSYATVEAALYHLWVHFPEKRATYLAKTKDIIGFNDHNVRILWLVLALNTPTYQSDKQAVFYKELSEYTAPAHHYSTRQNAFTYLESLQFFSDQSLIHLVDGSMHHYWKFRKFCRKLLDSLLTKPKYKKKYVALKGSLSKEQQAFLASKITQ